MRILTTTAVIAATVLFAGVSTGQAAVYKYTGAPTDLALSNGDWVSETAGPNFSTNWQFYFSKTSAGETFNDQLNVIKDGTVNQASPGDVWQGAIFWDAPANEVITSISLDYWVQGSNTRTYGILYVGDDLGTATVNKTYGGASSAVYSGSDTVNFTVAQNVTSIGLAVYGTNKNANMLTTWGGKFSNPIVTTTAVPEPAGIMTLLIGVGAGVLGLRSRRKRS